jgi:hypothetical protein
MTYLSVVTADDWTTSSGAKDSQRSEVVCITGSSDAVA